MIMWKIITSMYDHHYGVCSRCVAAFLMVKLFINSLAAFAPGQSPVNAGSSCFLIFEWFFSISTNLKSHPRKMNLLVWSSLLLATLNSLSFGEQLYHREGRFIDLGLHRYKTQLPSIHDIASTFIHYRVPVAVYVPTVRLNIGSRQKRIQYSSFPNSSASPKKAGPPAVQEAAQNKLPEETQPKSNNGEFISLSLLH